MVSTYQHKVKYASRRIEWRRRNQHAFVSEFKQGTMLCWPLLIYKCTSRIENLLFYLTLSPQKHNLHGDHHNNIHWCKKDPWVVWVGKLNAIHVRLNRINRLIRVDTQSPNTQMSLKHPYGVSVSCKNLLPPPQSTSTLLSPRKRVIMQKRIHRMIKWIDDICSLNSIPIKR